MKENKSLILMIFFAIFTLPLIFTPFTAFPWQYGKIILFHILTEALILCTLWKGFKQKKEWNFGFHWLDVLFFLFIGGLIVTSVTGVNFDQSFWMNQSRGIGVFTWIHLMLFYIFLRFSYSSQQEWKPLLQWSVGIAFLVSLTAVFQNFLPDFLRGDRDVRFSGIIGNPGFFASYIIPHIGIAFLLFFQEKNKPLRWIFALCGLFFVAMVWFSGIRGAFLGVIAGIFVFLLTSAKKSFDFIRQNKKVSLLMASIGIAFILAVSFFAKDAIVSSRLVNISGFLNGGQTRLMAWDIAWQAFLERPLFGWGWGNYEIPFSQKFNPKFLQHGFQETVWDKPHNVVLEILVSMGLFSIFYAGIFIVAVAFLFKKGKQVFDLGVGKNLLFGTFVAYGVQNIFLFDTISSLVIIGALLALIGSSQQSKWSVQIFYKRSLGIVITALVIFSLFLNIQFLRSSYFLQSAQSYTNVFGFSEAVHKVFSVETALEDENAILLADHMTKMEKSDLLASSNLVYWKQGAIELVNVLEKYGKKYPENISYPAWAGQVYLILGQFDNPLYFVQAVENFSRAEQMAPNKQEIKFLLVRAYLLQKDFEKALDTAQRAVDVDPSIGQSWNFLALTAATVGNTKDAITYFENAFAHGFSPSISQRLYIIDLFSGEKKYDFVIDQYRTLIEQEPFHSDWYAKLATAYALAGDKVKALETVNKAIQIDSSLQAEADAFIQQYKLR